MYCYVHGKSLVKNKSTSEIAPSNKTVKIKKASYNDVDMFGREYEGSIYQWLATKFL